MDSLDSEIEPGLGNTLEEDGEPGGSGAGDPSVSINTNVNLPSNNASSQIGKRKRKQPDEVELKMLKALEPRTPCSKMSFLQSLMPHLKNYTNREFLQFQMGVLNVIENINKTQETISHPHPNYSSSMPSYQPVSQYMSQPLPVIQEQAFLHAQQPSFPPRQYSGHFSTQISNNLDQHHPLPLHLYGPQNQSKPAHQTTPLNKSTPSKKETQSTSQYLQGFCHTDSSQSENVASPASGESTYSDIF